jgi:hypothetical protein
MGARAGTGRLNNARRAQAHAASLAGPAGLSSPRRPTSTHPHAALPTPPAPLRARRPSWLTTRRTRAGARTRRASWTAPCGASRRAAATTTRRTRPSTPRAGPARRCGGAAGAAAPQPWQHARRRHRPPGPAASPCPAADPLRRRPQANGNWSSDKRRLYEFVVRHFLACCSKEAVGQETVVCVDIAGEQFRTTGEGAACCRLPPAGCRRPPAVRADEARAGTATLRAAGLWAVPPPALL